MMLNQKCTFIYIIIIINFIQAIQYLPVFHNSNPYLMRHNGLNQEFITKRSMFLELTQKVQRSFCQDRFFDDNYFVFSDIVNSYEDKLAPNQEMKEKHHLISNLIAKHSC